MWPRWSLVEGLLHLQRLRSQAYRLRRGPTEIIVRGYTHRHRGCRRRGWRLRKVARSRVRGHAATCCEDRRRRRVTHKRQPGLKIDCGVWMMLHTHMLMGKCELRLMLLP